MTIPSRRPRDMPIPALLHASLPASWPTVSRGRSGATASTFFGSWVALFLAATFLAACSGGGGGGGGGGSPAPSPTAPIVVSQPQAVRVADGQPATFTVSAASATTPTYQWFRGGAAVAGATAASFTLPAAQLSDDGATFAVTITNAGGAVQSATATLNVSPVAPTIANDVARTVSVVAGQPATFTVMASGSAPLAFQWRRGGAAVSGATASTFTIPSTTVADNGAVFDLVVSNAAGSITSAPITLAVAPQPQPPTIATQPRSQAVRLGSPASFSVVAAGTAPFTYQWLRNGAAIAGAQQATYTLSTTSSSDNGALFAVVVTNGAGTVTSRAATLTVTTEESLSLLAGNIGGPGSIDGTGARARFTLPSGVAVDGSGNTFVADGNAIRKVSPTGAVTTFAGSIVAGAADGAGTAASFRGVGGLAIDAAGNLFVADSGNQAIRQITPAGNVTTLAGTAGSAGSADGTGAAARFSNPNDVALDGLGNLYVADTGNQLIRKIAPGAVVTTIAGSAGMAGSVDGTGAAALFNLPGGVAADAQGNVYVADTGNSTIRSVATNGVVTTLAGAAGVPGSIDGAGGAARFNGPTDVAIDRAGNLAVTDSIGLTVRRLTPAGVATTIAGTAGVKGSADGSGAAASFARPFAVASDASGVLFVADRDNYALRRIDPNAVVSTVAGAAVVQGAADGIGAAATFNVPIGIAADAAGNVFVADYFNATIRRIASSGQTATIAGLAGTPGFVDGPAALARFTTPQGIAVDGAGNVYVADINSHTIRKLSAAGVVTTIAGTPGVAGSANGVGAAATFTFPNAVAVDAAGNVYVTERANTIRRITPAGVVTTVAGTANRAGATDGPGATALFSFPYGIAVDAAGNLFVADSGNSTIRRIATDGTVTTVAGIAGRQGSLDGAVATATFAGPTGIAIDGAGNLFVADVLARTIREITTAGTVRTIAGVADGRRGVALGALPGHLDTPVQLALDPAGFLYCTDANGVIRIVLP